MDYNNQDIIIARATPIGSAALAIIRISGLNLSPLLYRITSINKVHPWRVHKVDLKSPHNQNILDTCLLTFFQGPKSFTGEDMIELSCHGGEGLVALILNHFIKAKIRLAYPGEFSYRAFQNNKIDLMQAESIAIKIHHGKEYNNIALQNLEKGATSNKLSVIKNNIIKIISIIEHELDFNEEEITHLSKQNILRGFKKLNTEIMQILRGSFKLEKMNAGYKIVLLGRPNSGKSTLFNNIIGTNRAIVTDIKGTTRDVLEAHFNIQNIPVTLYDTAGYRTTKDKIEKLGIEKTLDIASQANIIMVVDEKSPTTILNRLIKRLPKLKNKEFILIHSKQDSLKKVKIETKDNVCKIKLSAQNDRGINALLTHLLTIIEKTVVLNDCDNVALCTVRQIDLLNRGHAVIKEIIVTLNDGLDMDVVASLCREFIGIIEEMLGEITSNEILNNIFKGFCVGK